MSLGCDPPFLCITISSKFTKEDSPIRTFAYAEDPDKYLFSGCKCIRCVIRQEEALSSARERWDLGEREIVFAEYDTESIESCIGNLHERKKSKDADMFVNGYPIAVDMKDAKSIIAGITAFLDIEGVAFGDDG